MKWHGTLLLMTSVAAFGRVHSVSSQAPCNTPVHRAFDFWTGDWDVFDAGDSTKVVAHARVDTILAGCALREIYEGNNGLNGQSFSIYDAERGAWHQSWVTNRGEVLQIDGGITGDRMVLSGTQRPPGGKPRLIRGEWWKEGKNVREKAEISVDGGKAWEPLFDLVFRVML